MFINKHLSPVCGGSAAFGLVAVAAAASLLVVLVDVVAAVEEAPVEAGHVGHEV